MWTCCEVVLINFNNFAVLHYKFFYALKLNRRNYLLIKNMLLFILCISKRWQFFLKLQRVARFFLFSLVILVEHFSYTFRTPCYPWLSSPSPLFLSLFLSFSWRRVYTAACDHRRVYVYGMYGGRQTRGQVEGCATCCSVAGTRANSRMSPLGFGCRSAWDGTPEEHSARGYSNHNGASLPPRVYTYIRICVRARTLSLFDTYQDLASSNLFFPLFSARFISSSSSSSSLSTAPLVVVFSSRAIYSPPSFFLDIAPSGHDPDLTWFA